MGFHKKKRPIQQTQRHKHCILTDKRFKIAVMKKLNELQENSEGHFNELRNKINQRG